MAIVGEGEGEGEVELDGRCGELEFGGEARWGVGGWVASTG